MRSLARIGVLAAALLALSGFVAATASARSVVLGSASFAGPQGQGWGTARPAELYNGGDPSGLVTHIRWHRWGGRTAFGIGRNAIFKPRGGYYRRPVTIRLHAAALGRCRPGGPPAYRRLYVREPLRPGGPLGRWFPWSGARSLCHSGF